MTARLTAEGVASLAALPRAALAGALGAGTALRGARVFHPRGALRTAVVTALGPTGGEPWGARLLDEPGEHTGVARLSRGLGLPAPLPDVDGLALRLPGLGRGGAPLDLLVNAAWRIAFAPTPLARTWSSVLPFRTGSGRLVLLGARPRSADVLDLLAAPLLGAWRPWGQVRLGKAVATDPGGEALRTDPGLGAEDLQPVALLRRTRALAYRASQAARAAG